MTHILALALGHVRNATWQLLSIDRPDQAALGLECLDLEALLNPDDIDPDVVDPEPDAAASLTAVRHLLGTITDQVPPAAWATLQSLRTKLG